MNNETADILRQFENLYISFPSFERAVTAIIDNVNLHRDANLVNNLLIVGESGAGKSSLCDVMLNKYPRTRTRTQDKISALYVPVPAAASIKNLSEAVLWSLGDPLPGSGSNTSKTNRIVTLCRNCEVKLILFDEAQHLYDRGREKTHYMVGDWLKRLIDELNIPIVFLGLPRLERLLQTNEQLRRRFSKRLQLKLGQLEGIAIETECLQLFMTLGESLRLRLSPGDYAWPELGLRLYYATDGRIAFIKKLLSSSLQYALEHHETVIGPEQLARAFTEDIWWGGIGALNPFHPEFQFRRLDRGGEPFEYFDMRLSHRK